MSYNVLQVPDSGVEFGAAPHWDMSTKSLYYVNVSNAEILRYNPIENTIHRSKVPYQKYASFIVPVECRKDKFVVGCGNRVLLVNWNGQNNTCKHDSCLMAVQCDSTYENNRFNDGKCDPCGRLFAGTMAVDKQDGLFETRFGELYKYRCKTPDVIKSEIGMSNGMTWNAKAKKFYFIDSADFEIKEYDYDCYTGIASYPRIIYRFPRSGQHDDPYPYGMTIDAEGNLYVAMHKAGIIYKIDPVAHKVLEEIVMPVKNITSLAFGGENLNVLYVLSSGDPSNESSKGSVYQVSGSSLKGVPMQKLII